MCLSTIKNHNVNPKKRKGYKIFVFKRNPDSHRKEYTGYYVSSFRYFPVKENYAGVAPDIKSMYSGKYKPGFHIYRNFRDAKDDLFFTGLGIIRKVEYREFIEGVNCIDVAQYMRILPTKVGVKINT